MPVLRGDPRGAVPQPEGQTTHPHQNPAHTAATRIPGGAVLTPHVNADDISPTPKGDSAGKRYRTQDKAHRRKPCIDCTDEGITTHRKAPHPGPRCATHHRAKRVVRKAGAQEARWLKTYGITAQEYWAIYEAQGGVCAICQRHNGRTKRLSVDHCHRTGVVRGLLDTTCNAKILGHLRDDPQALQRAINYLHNPPAVQVIGERTVPGHE